MIRDLNELIKRTGKDIQIEIEALKEFKFSKTFSDYFAADSGWLIEFFDYSAKIKTSGSNFVLANSSWFYIAALLQDVLQELNQYKALALDGFNNTILNTSTNATFLGWTTSVRGNAAYIPASFDTYLLTLPGMDQSKVNYVRSFLSNYQWWGGGKIIGRTQDDFAQSAIMSISGLLNESSGYVGQIAEVMKSHPRLKTEIINCESKQRNYLFKKLHLNHFAKELFEKLFEEYPTKVLPLLTFGQTLATNGINYDPVSLPLLNSIFARFQTQPTQANLSTAGNQRWTGPVFQLGNEYLYITTQWAHPPGGNFTFASLNEFLKEYFPAYIIDFKNVNSEVLYFLKFREFQNKIFYGAPGTGKSYLIKQLVGSENFLRVTVNPEYTYSQFVGAYKPVMDGAEIKYSLVPGPFLEALKKAHQNSSCPFYLILEEINRTNVASLFGDIFQLLDRTDSGSSEYGIQLNADIMKYLHDNGVINSQSEEVTLPSNLFIYASMNSADQGVFPLDTAFKRRWNMQYVPIDQGENAISTEQLYINDSLSLNWNNFRKDLNSFLQNNGIQEDKLLGAFFLNKSDLNTKAGFSGKLLIYLWDDVLRHGKRSLIFRATSLTQIHTAIEASQDINSFCDNIFSEQFISTASFQNP